MPNDIETLDRALMFACKRIADSDQTYEEANTPDGWRDVFIRRAEIERLADEHARYVAQ